VAHPQGDAGQLCGERVELESADVLQPEEGAEDALVRAAVSAATTQISFAIAQAHLESA
jgi:hypothetical protein